MPNPNDNSASFSVNVDLNDSRARQQFAQLIRDLSNQTVTLNAQMKNGVYGVTGGSNSASIAQASAGIAPAVSGGGSTMRTRPAVSHSSMGASGMAFATAQQSFTSARKAYADPYDGFAAMSGRLQDIARDKAYKNANPTGVTNGSNYYQQMGVTFGLNNNLRHAGREYDEAVEGDDWLRGHSERATKAARAAENRGTRSEVQFNRTNSKRNTIHDKAMQKAQDRLDSERVDAYDAADVAADRVYLKQMRRQYAGHAAATRASFGFADMDDGDIKKHVAGVFGGNPFSKYDPALYNTGMLVNGQDPAMAAQLAGLKTRAALQSVFNFNASNNAYIRMQQRYAGQAIAGVANSVIGGGMQAYAQNSAAGEYDPMQMAGYYGGSVGAVTGFIGGGIVGAAAPVPEPGLGALLGSQLGLSVGTAAGQMFLAPYARTRTAVSTLAPVAARLGVDAYDLFGAARFNSDPVARQQTMTRGTLSGGLEDLANTVSFSGKSAKDTALIKMGLYTGTDIISGPQAATTFATMARGYLANGSDDISPIMDSTWRLAKKYGINATTVAGMAAGVLGRSASLGDSDGDLRLQSGPEAYGAYADSQGLNGFTPRQMLAYGGQQRARFRLGMADTLARGRGLAREVAGEDLLNNLAPFGTDTHAYRSAQADQRQARLQRYDEEDVSRFSMPRARLEANAAIIGYMPFSPVNGIKNSVDTINLDRREYSAKYARYTTLMKQGGLSEAEQGERYKELLGLRTDIYRNIGHLSEGMEDRLPGLSSNAPAGSSRWNSINLAALNLKMRGSGIMAYGAWDSKQAASQMAQFKDMGGDGGMMGHSTTQGFNTSGESNSLLRRMADALDRIAGSGGGTSRNGEASSQLSGQLSRRSDATPGRTN